MSTTIVLYITYFYHEATNRCITRHSKLHRTSMVYCLETVLWQSHVDSQLITFVSRFNGTFYKYPIHGNVCSGLFRAKLIVQKHNVYIIDCSRVPLGTIRLQPNNHFVPALFDITMALIMLIQNRIGRCIYY